MSFESVIWIIICIVMVIAEIATLQLVSIWFAGGALLAFIASFFLPFEWQFGIFAVYSLALLICTMPLIKKFKNLFVGGKNVCSTLNPSNGYSGNKLKRKKFKLNKTVNSKK